MTTLIVEDSPEVATIIELSLRPTGMKFVHVANGPQALEYLARERPQLIILDIGLPGMDGWEVLDRMREHKHLSDIPIIVMTAHADSDSRKTGKLYMVDAYLTKPVSPAVIRETVERVMAVN
jgi:CheY-like chemotaxis protein